MQVKLWIWTGSAWIEALSDASGHLQVDILSSALPTGAATEAKQDTLIGHVDGLEGLLGAGLPVALDTLSLKVKEQSPLSGFATSAKQDTMITALQLIDDLRNALGSVNTDDLQVDVKTMPEITQDTPSACKVEICQPGTKETFTLTPERGQYLIPSGATDRSDIDLSVSADDNAWTDVTSFTPANGKVVYLSFLNLGTLAGTGIMELNISLAAATIAFLIGYNGILLNPNIPIKLATGDGASVLLLQVRHHAGVTTTVRGAWQVWEV